MTRISLLLSTGLKAFRASVGPNDTPARDMSPSFIPNRIGILNLARGRGFSLPCLIMGAIAALWMTTAMAQSHTIYVAPKFIYNDGNNSTPYETTLSAAWSDVQGVLDYCSDNTCYTVQNLHPAGPGIGDGALLFNGTPYQQFYDRQSCTTPGGCNTTTNVGYIQTGITCPPGGGAGNYGNLSTDPSVTNNLIACAMTIYDVQPLPNNCKSKSCLGNPILASTGQKFEMETDYVGASGLDFTRTYRSNNGFFASVLTQAFANNSLPAGTASPACYPAYWTYGSASGFYCFPYMSVYPYVNNGVAQYQLQTDDGRSIEFSSPSGAVTARADVNEQVAQLTMNGATEWQVHRDDDTIELYNAAGNLIQKTLRGGRTFTYSYSTTSTPANIAPKPGLLLTESDSFDHTLSWQYNIAGQMVKMIDPAGGIYQYSYDSSGNLTSVIYPDSSSKTYWYNESANTGGANLPTALTGITDENGVRSATFQYNSAGLAVNTQHAGGVESYTFNYPYTAYTGQNYTATVTDPLGTARTYNFSEDGLSYNLDTSQIQPAASGSGTVTQSETYDANGNPASVTDFNGNVTTSVYDLSRNLETSRTEGYGTTQARTIATQWNATWRQPALITEPNRTTAYTYDALGNVLTKTVTDTSVSPNGSRTWTYTYDSYGRMLTAVGPRTDVTDKTTYSYYTCMTGGKCGELQTITDAVGNVTTFNTYNAHGQPLTITDANGVVTTLTYDKRLRLLSRQVGTETTSYSYYPTGLLKQVTQPDASYVLYTYDNAHRLTQIGDGLGNRIKYTLDNAGNRTAENAYDPSNVLHRTHTRVINALNKISAEINSAGIAGVTTSFGYDDNGNLLTSAAPLARNTTDRYDPLNRLTQVTDPATGVTQFGYDANDNLASVIDPRSLTTTYAHNGFGDVTQVVSPDTSITTNTYDSGGNLKTTQDARGALATYSYDALNRVTKATYSDQTINLTYDAGTNGKGRLTGASDANHSMNFGYDTLGRVSAKSQTVAGATKSISYTYTNGDLTTLVTPSGQTITYAYSNHRVASIKVGSTTLLSSVTYDPFGPVTGWTWGNGTMVTRAYDEDGNPHQIVTAAVTNAYTVDEASRILGISDSGQTSGTFTFGYDQLDRVTSGHSSAKSRGYTYDANGNRLTTTGTTASTETIGTTSNRLNATTGGLVRTYGYDAAGNTTSFTGDTFTFNQRGRMATATVSAGTTTYIYNALGQLIEKEGNGGTTLLMYDEAGHILGEYTSSGTLIEETIWMGDVPVATLRPSGSTAAIYYVHTDHLNTPRKITRPSDNAQLWRWDPDTFGSVAPAGSISYNLRFPGHYALNETGLFYNYFRDYDPQMGRYLESDPIGLKGGSYSPYAYASNDPIIYIDPFGLCWVYSQSTGQLTHVDANGNADYTATGGYSGYGTGLNNPAMQSVQQQTPGGPAGPIPAQSYSIGRPFHSAQTGPGAMRLTPVGGLNALGRKDLEIHGDNSAHNHTASTGCIIEGPAVRKKIAQGLANDNCLQVFP